LTPDGSNVSRFAASQLGKRLLSKLIELPCGGIAFDLTIPSRPIVLVEPISKGGELLVAQLLNFLFERLDLCHGGRKFYADVTHFTGDIDFFVRITPPNARRLLAALADFGFGNLGIIAKQKGPTR
jgi:hypothetical protein